MADIASSTKEALNTRASSWDRKDECRESMLILFPEMAWVYYAPFYI